MTFQKNLKPFLAGMAFPAVFMPLAYTLLFLVDTRVLRAHPLQFIPMYIPLLFGITNILYFKFHAGTKKKKSDISLWLTGACLGLVVAIFGIFVFNIPTLVFGLTKGLKLLPLVLLPIIYGAIFRFIVKRLNKELAI